MKRLCEIEIGSWFRFIGSKHKCKYFGEVDCDIVPNKKLYLFRRDHNGQGYFIINGNQLVYEIQGAGGAKTLKVPTTTNN